jgi:glycosyltransferase involved in cell wall biosynthesis
MYKVLRILNRTNVGGPVLNATLLTHFLAPEFTTTLLAGHPTPNETQADALLRQFDVTPVYLDEMGRSLNLLADWRTFFKLRRLIKQLSPQVVHTHAAKPGAVGRLAAASCRVPVIIHTFHGHIFHSYFSPAKTRFFIAVERFLARFTTRIIAISPLQRQELVETYKIAPAKKFAVIPLGLYLSPFMEHTAEKRLAFRKQYNIADHVVVVSIVGRLAPVKNHQLFIKALALLQQRSLAFKAFIVGDGECRADIELCCAKHHLKYCKSNAYDDESSVIFTSWRSDIDVVNAGSDIIALSSLNEGTPVSLIEAQATGRAIVSTNCGGIGDVVIPGETALINELHDETAFAENLYKLALNEPLRSEMAKKGQEWVQQKFSHTRLVNDVRNLYLTLLNDTKHPKETH